MLPRANSLPNRRSQTHRMKAERNGLVCPVAVRRVVAPLGRQWLGTVGVPGLSRLPILLGLWVWVKAQPMGQAAGPESDASLPGKAEPRVVLKPAPLVQMRGANSPAPDQPGDTDCNSPAHWDGDTLYLFNSAGHPWRSAGPDLFHLDRSYIRCSFNNRVRGGRWIESSWKAADGVLYGWYHHEPASLCPGTGLTAPKIGAVRSTDNGATWTDLGIVLEARPGTLRCDTTNHFFAGGHGDFCALMDARGEYLYFFLSTYAGETTEQGLALARMRWTDRDQPVGRVWKWHQGQWTEPGLGGRVTPFLPVKQDWHRPDVDAFWGPSVHWNTHLQQYVMLLNRATNRFWAQEGVYVSFNPDLANPTGWTPPRKILGDLKPEQWYPQVLGLDAARRETDKLCGRVGRLFVRGQSRWEIVFLRPGESE